MFYLLIFGTAQHDLTGCSTGILGVVLVEKVAQVGLIGGSSAGWLSWGLGQIAQILQGGSEFWAT